MPRQKRNSRKSGKPRNTRQQVKNPGIRLWAFFQIVLVILFCSAIYIIWLDHRIRSEFEGKKWSLPARVYSSPLELYSDLKLTLRQTEDQLRAIGYQRVNEVHHPGEYSKTGDSLVYVSRAFEFWDGPERSRRIKIGFSNGQVGSIQDEMSGESIPVTRIEPQLIGKLYPAHQEDRTLISYEEVPPGLIDALIAVEDRNYFNHAGIDPKGIVRAMLANLFSGEIRQGGSTLTQQLVKNFFLSRERTFWRKSNEIIMAFLLEWHYTKNEILGAYINEIYLGQNGAQGIHGFGTASEFYFGRPLGELRLDQLALLVALVKGASFYNPRNHPERALERRNLVLQLMFEQDYINQQEYQSSLQMPLDVAETPGWSRAKYPAFVELVKRQLERDYKQEDLRTEGLRIFTTLNPAYQEISEKAVRQRLAQLENSGNRKPGSIQPAIVMSSVETGEILALVGGRDEDRTGFNRALDASRPIGSLIKPVIYLSALLHPDKFNLLSQLEDIPVEWKQAGGQTWSPENYDGTAHGQVALYKALEQSYNLATVRLGLNLGMSTFKSTLKRLGVSRAVPEYPSVFLGAIEFTPYEVMQIYQVLAGNGFRVPPRAIREVLDREGKPLQRYPLEISAAVDSKAVYLVNYLLTRVVRYGTARTLSRRMPDFMPYAGKTGTTNDLRDSWFAGYGEKILAVVWLGKDDNTPTGLTGSSGALQVWTDVMQEIKPEPLSMIPPDGVRMVAIRDQIRVSTDCPGSERFPFIEPYLPVEHACPLEQQDRKKSGDSPWSILDIFR